MLRRLQAAARAGRAAWAESAVKPAAPVAAAAPARKSWLEWLRRRPAAVAATQPTTTSSAPAAPTSAPADALPDEWALPPRAWPALDRARYVLRLEQALTSQSPPDRSPPVSSVWLLRAPRLLGFPARALHNYEWLLPAEQCARPDVASEYWLATDEMHEQMRLQQAAAREAAREALRPVYQADASSDPAIPSVPADTRPRYGVQELLPAQQEAPSVLWRVVGVLGLAYLCASGWVAYQLTKSSSDDDKKKTPGDADKKKRPVFSEADKKKLQKMVEELTGLSGMEHLPAEKPSTRFSDVIGCDEAKEEVAECVAYLKDPAKFTRLGGRMTKGVLMLGPPGVGKTLLARAVAGEAGVPFFSRSGSDFEELYVGMGPKRVRELFAAARAVQPAVIFIDEIDAIALRRDHAGDKYGEFRTGGAEYETLHALLTELDGFNDSSKVIVFAATNHAESLDRALLRPGRFDRQVVLELPDVKARRALLQFYCNKVKLAEGVDLTHLARRTSGMSGADLANLVNLAAVGAARRDQLAVSERDLHAAHERLSLGMERKSSRPAADVRRQVAVYEGGKAMVAACTPHALPLHSVTITQRGSRLGRTAATFDDDHDRLNQDYRQMAARLDTLLAGREAEELEFGNAGISSNGAEDLDAANRLARAMVMQLAFGDASSKYVSDSSVARFGEAASDATKQQVDEEVQHLLDQSRARVRDVLRQRRRELVRITDLLLERDTLKGDVVRDVVRGKEPPPYEPDEALTQTTHDSQDKTAAPKPPAASGPPTVLSTHA